jgi:hypothetical protein
VFFVIRGATPQLSTLYALEKVDDSLILLAVDAKLGCETERRDLQTNLDDHERDGDEFSDGWVWDEECLAACDSVLAGAVKAPEKCSSRSLSQVVRYMSAFVGLILTASLMLTVD